MMEMAWKETLKWIAGIALLFAPAFAFIDVALSECAGGVTAEDLQRIRWFVDDVTIMRNHGFIEKVQPVKGRLFPVTAIAVFIAGLLMSEPSHPLMTKWENIKTTIWISILLSLVPYGGIFFVPIFTSILRFLFFHGEAGCLFLDVIEVSADYAIGSYNLLMRENFLQLLGFLACSSLLMLAAMLPRTLIGIKRGMYLEDKHPLRKVLFELMRREVEEEKRRLLQQANSGGNWSTQAKRHSTPDISVFTDHIRRSIEEAKKRKDGGKRRGSTYYMHKRQEKEAGETQVFKRRVKEKDRTSYIA